MCTMSTMSTMSTLKIVYHLIDSPFKYNLTYLNDSLKYQPPNDKSVSFYGGPKAKIYATLFTFFFGLCDSNKANYHPTTVRPQEATIKLENYAQLHLSDDSRESSFTDSHGSFFGSL